MIRRYIPVDTELNDNQCTEEKVFPIVEDVESLLKSEIAKLQLSDRVSVLNQIRDMLHRVSPFQNEPVDCVRWVPFNSIVANDYNPNTVAPPEMKLLEVSISEDGYTQPIVVWEDAGKYVVVDGFHRNRVGKESLIVRGRIKGYLPVTIVNPDRIDRGDRIASTIRHNRARGKHQVQAMSDIVVELKNRNWSNERIAKNLGMDEDEILRLCQITGLAGLFADQDFSKSWDLEDAEPDFEPISDDFELEASEVFRTVNTSDPGRVFHVYTDWECYKAGLYATTKSGMSRQECEQAYCDFLSDSELFGDALSHVIVEWVNSCEQYLTNTAMNRIAWLGQAAMCYATGVPATFRGGFNLMSSEDQIRANEVALVYLNKWLLANGRDVVSMEEALSDNQSDLY